MNWNGIHHSFRSDSEKPKKATVGQVILGTLVVLLIIIPLVTLPPTPQLNKWSNNANNLPRDSSASTEEFQNALDGIYLENSSLAYQTNIEELVGKTGQSNSFHVNNTQNINTTQSNEVYVVDETITTNNTNSDYNSIRNNYFSYRIYNTSSTPNSPQNKSHFPFNSNGYEIFVGNWPHLYDISERQITINARDLSYITENAQSIYVTYQEPMVLTYGETSINTLVYKGSLSEAIIVGCG